MKFCIRRRRMNSSSFHLWDLMVYLSFETAPEKVVPRRLRPATLSAFRNNAIIVAQQSLSPFRCCAAVPSSSHYAFWLLCRSGFNTVQSLLKQPFHSNYSKSRDQYLPRDIDRLHTIPLPSERVMILIGVPLDQWSIFCLSVYPDKFKCVLTDVHNFWTAISCYNIFSGKSTI